MFYNSDLFLNMRCPGSLLYGIRNPEVILVHSHFESRLLAHEIAFITNPKQKENCCSPYYDNLLYLAKTLLFSNISIFSAVSFLLNHQVGLSCDSWNSAPQDICCRAACICFLINVTNKSFLHFKGTQFFWVHHWIREWGKAGAKSVLTQGDCEPVPCHLRVKILS